MLSRIALDVLRTYVRKERPEDWLFPGAAQGSHVTLRSVQKAFERALRKSGIAKKDIIEIFPFLR